MPFLEMGEKNIEVLAKEAYTRIKALWGGRNLWMNVIELRVGNRWGAEGQGLRR